MTAVAALPSNALTPEPNRLRGLSWQVWLIVFLSCALYGALRAPVPGVNEPHYLTKSRHFWDASWCARDQFLNTANAHWFFYASVGSLTKVFSLSEAAWIGRILGWCLFASGWCALAGRLLPGVSGGAIWSLWLWLASCAVGNFSGEWIIGGVEGKLFSYACVLHGLAAGCAGRWVPAAIWAGWGVSFHPIVGLWSSVALFGVAATEAFGLQSSASSPSKRTLVRALSSGLLCALPGLIPVGTMVLTASPSDSRQADILQVFHRLAHHLDPQRFPLRAYLGYSLLLVTWLILRWGVNRWTADQAVWQRFQRFVAGTLVIAGIGLAVGWTIRTPALMKFYLFRTADMFLPIAVAFGLTMASTRLPRGIQPVAAFAAGMLFLMGVMRPAVDSDPNRMQPQQRADWIAACQWIREQTPANALCWSSYGNWGFRWYAERGEYVSFKDCPQDAAGLVEWNRRLHALNRWQKRHPIYTQHALRELRQKTGLDYILARDRARFAIPPVFENATCQVYRLPQD